MRTIGTLLKISACAFLAVLVAVLSPAFQEAEGRQNLGASLETSLSTHVYTIGHDTASFVAPSISDFGKTCVRAAKNMANNTGQDNELPRNFTSVTILVGKPAADLAMAICGSIDNTTRISTAYAAKALDDTRAYAESVYKDPRVALRDLCRRRCNFGEARCQDGKVKSWCRTILGALKVREGSNEILEELQGGSMAGESTSMTMLDVVIGCVAGGTTVGGFVFWVSASYRTVRLIPAELSLIMRVASITSGWLISVLGYVAKPLGMVVGLTMLPMLTLAVVWWVGCFIYSLGVEMRKCE